MLTEADYDLALIEKHARLRESEGEGQSETPGLQVEALHVWVVALGSLIATAYGLHRFTSFGGGLTSSLSVAVAVVAFFLWWWVENHHLNKKKTAWERRVHDHNRTRDQLVADGTLIPLDALAPGVRHDAGMGEDFDRTEEYVATARQNSDAAEVTTHVLDFWTRYWTRSSAVRRELAEVDEILDTAPDRYESDAISQVRARRETLTRDLKTAREETRSVVGDGRADAGSTADAARAQQADQKADAYLTRASTRRGPS